MKRAIKRNPGKLKETITGYLLIMPNLIGFFVFTFVGVVFSLFMSFTDWSLIKPLSEVKFVFLKNYTQLVSDRWFIASVKNNVWFTLFHPRFGPLNNFLRLIGIRNPPGWLADIHWSKPALGIVIIWINLGYYALLYLAALQGIPGQLYEAAEIDGTNAWRKFFPSADFIRNLSFYSQSPIK